jgi:hypothetical protein
LTATKVGVFVSSLSRVPARQRSLSAGEARRRMNLWAKKDEILSLHGSDKLTSLRAFLSNIFCVKANKSEIPMKIIGAILCVLLLAGRCQFFPPNG